MPIYEYACSSCGHRFEDLVFGSRAPACPECAGTDVEKQFSTFAVGARTGPPPSPGACGTCGDPRGPGACSLDA